MAVGGKVKDYFHNVYQPGERVLIQKIDFFILTFCCLSYFVNYVRLCDSSVRAFLSILTRSSSTAAISTMLTSRA